MLDLIIPVYNDKEGLCRSLMSIGTECNPKELFITIIDDASTVDYSSVIQTFQQFYPIRILKMKKNGGPGKARQYALEHTKEPYLMFLDCGDVFVTPESLRNIMATVISMPNFDLYEWGYNTETIDGYLEREGCMTNRLHGKVYKRDFIYDKNIHFCVESSYQQEDIGFNINVRLHKPQVYQNDDTVITWKFDENSITRQNDCAFYYQKSASGLAFTVGAAIDNAMQNGVEHKDIISQIYDCMAADYIFYLSCKNRRPEFLEETYAGCLLFYVKYFKRIPEEEQDIELFKNIWYNILRNHMDDENDPIRDKMVSFDILGWLNQLEKDSSEM